ncbi:hypothetical protein BDZ91DRAFT_544236 [Kalaharituber pfeilii]|nr:hypothetical protein BDZ91DRAFT_544236 [Kalaharituber pfeilii]
MEVQDREGRQSGVQMVRIFFFFIFFFISLIACRPRGYGEQMVRRSRGNNGTHLGALQNMEKEVAGGVDRPVHTQKRGRQGDDGHAGDAADVGEVGRIGEGRRGFTTLLQPLISVISR